MGNSGEAYKIKTTKIADSVKDIKIAIPIVILGVHSNVGEDAGFTDGHAWITVTTNGMTQYYGLWPPEHPLVKSKHQEDDPTHVRKGYEAGQKAVASRYYRLDPAKQLKLYKWLGVQSHWRYTHTCASWASETVNSVVGESISADELVGITGTPRELSESILALERKVPTSIGKPIEYQKPITSSLR
jgi:hypothetical protein